jgi:hypothetical protein
VPATLSLSLAAPAQFGAFTPGIDKDYSATQDATVTTTAGDATLTVSDPSSFATGRLVNGTFALTAPLQAKAGNGTLADVTGTGPVLQTWSGPTSKEGVKVTFGQHVGKNEALRTGTYAKTLTFTLSTTSP